ncbi:Gfo/Idh/MocA family protein [Paenibacillus sp. FA6]|uniref:Gfo/Idh/MocA family protein n=1 Tax=Paenibacillus sp. FA6 TaxID=3413029 RepID=UPI003F6580D9
MLKVAVIGLGDVSAIHLTAIQANSNVELVAICDIDETRKSMVPQTKFYTDYNEMLDNEAIDCVHICLPHYLHYPVTRACVEKGVHVFQEKPLALNEEEGLALLKIEEEHKDIKICLCMQNRFNESFEKLQEIVNSGQNGKIIGIKGLVTWFRPKDYYKLKPWRGTMAEAGGGVMINQSIHTLDLMQLLGGPIKGIRGSLDNLLDYGIEVEDTATAHIKFENGAKGLFFATNSNFGNSSVELQVVFENEKFTIKDSTLTRVNENGKKEKMVEDAKLPGAKFYYGASHMRLINHFYSCIESDSQDYVHVKDALTSIQMIDAIRKSSELKTEMKMGG